MSVKCDIKVRLFSDRSVFTLNARFSCRTPSIMLFGPSGSGKSLTLMALAGLLRPESGTITLQEKVFFDSKRKINIPARKRKVGILFQDYALFPHLSVRHNVGFGLKTMFLPLNKKQKNKVSEFLEMFGLENQADKKPHQLSGGQRQRVALARALVSGPDLLLLDEPFSALDQPLRIKMRQELKNILSEFDMPMVMVSHDLEDVEVFGETLVAFGHGQVQDILDYRALRKRGKQTVDILKPLYDAANANSE